MSMFDWAIGNSGWPEQVLMAVRVIPAEIPRYRDHWVERDSEDSVIVAIYTRVGGGNRPDYQEWLSNVRLLPSFVSDSDDEFDSTYCTLRFRLYKHSLMRWFGIWMGADNTGWNGSDEVWAELQEAALPEPRNMSEVWKSAIDALESQVKGE